MKCFHPLQLCSLLLLFLIYSFWKPLKHNCCMTCDENVLRTGCKTKEFGQFLRSSSCAPLHHPPSFSSFVFVLVIVLLWGVVDLLQCGSFNWIFILRKRMKFRGGKSDSVRQQIMCHWQHSKQTRVYLVLLVRRQVTTWGEADGEVQVSAHWLWVQRVRWVQEGKAVSEAGEAENQNGDDDGCEPTEKPASRWMWQIARVDG